MHHAPVEVRPFREADADFVSRLGASAFAEFSRHPGNSACWMAEHHPCVVAQHGKERLGFAVVELAAGGNVAHLAAIAVVEWMRGRGVGWRLLERAESLAKARGFGSLRAHTADFNLAALDLLWRNGYRIVARHPRFYRSRFSACELDKRLVETPAPP